MKRVEALRLDIASDTPATVAQAAFDAGGLYRSREALIPHLLTALKRNTWSEASHGSRVINHILDALIRLDAEVPMALLERQEEPVYTATEVLILAARNGAAAHPLLRRVLRGSIEGQEIEIAGIAAGNLLAAANDDRMVAIFLPRLRPHVSVTVFDHDRFGGRSGSTRVGTGCARCKIPEGFPPAVWYVLSFSGLEWQPSLVAKGTVESVWYVRHVEERREYFGCRAVRDRNVTEIGLGWAATLLGISLEDLHLKPRYYKSHRWSTPEAYRAHMGQVRAEIQRAVGTLLDGFLKAGLLTRKERLALAVEPQFEVRDNRDDRSVPLPEVLGADGR